MPEDDVNLESTPVAEIEQDLSMTNEDALLYEHPDYKMMEGLWTKYTDCYEATNLSNYLHRHLRESTENFDKRVERGYYYNYVSALIDLYVAYLYHSPIVRDIPKNQTELFDAIYLDADLSHVSYSIFMQQAAMLSQANGHCGVLVDAPQAPEDGFRNEKERKDADHRPYLQLIQASQIKDWELDEFGNFVWVKIEIHREPARSWNTAVDEDIRHFVIWSTTDWEVWELQNHEAKKVETEKHSLGRVPLVIIRNDFFPRHEWFGLSAIRDIADINLSIFNWSSMGDEEIYERCLNVLTMEKGDGASVALSHCNVLEYEEGTHPPEYMTPGTSPLDLIGAWIDRAKDEIYRLAKLGGTVGVAGIRTASSGIAYAFEFGETNQALSKKAEHLEKAEVEIHGLIANWQGQEFEGTIEYPREFGVDDFLLEFSILAEARTTLTSETAIKTIEKRVIGKLFSMESTATRKEMTAEIEAAEAQPLAGSFAALPTGMLGGDSGKPGDEASSPQNAGTD